MAEISVGAAVNEGFALIRRSPTTVLIWGLAQIGLVALVFTALSPLYIAMFEAVRAGAGGAAALQSNPAIAQTQGLSYLINIVELGFGAVMYCAGYRAVLHPERGQFAYLRLGMAELFVAALLIGLNIALVIGIIIVAIVVGIVIAILAVMHLVPVAIAVGVAAALALLIGGVYLALRFSLVGPMIVDDGKFHFEDAWALTRGHVLQLLLVALVLFLIIIAAEIVIGIIVVAIGLGGLTVAAGGLANLPTFFQQPAPTVIARLGPMLLVAAIIWIPIAGSLNAILLAPWARAYRDLKPIDVAATFS